MTKRGLLLWVLAAFVLMTAMPTWAANTPPKAGSITALLPTAKITRGSGKQAVTTEAKKGDALVWNDLVKTEKGGRARITLADQSILSLGSQAELRIVKHDAKSQQTALEMAYGRVRAQVANITRDGGSFELRTPTAVAGVIGTDFGVDSSSVGGDTFVCLAGAVQISNSNKTVPGSVQCSAGQTTTVQPGKPPSPPQPASPQQLQKIIEDTEPAIIASISPAAALPGTTFDTTIAGQNMAQINNVAVSGAGVAVTLKSAAATGVQIHLVVDPAAAPGARTITLTNPAGAASAAVFTVLGPPTGDPRTAYLQTLQQLTAAGTAGLGGFLTGAQQSADVIAQAVTNANLNLPKPIDLSNFANALNQQYGTVQNALQNQDTAIQAASQAAAAQFQAAYDAAYQALLQRNPSGTPDSTFNTAITTAFQNANNTLQAAISGSQSTLNGTVQNYSSSLTQIQQDWIQNINAAALAEAPGPTPKVNALERDVELGAVASFDASGSTANQGQTIASTSWVVCSPSYQPQGFGSPLDPSTAACNGIQGLSSTQSEFDIPTCSLNAGTYFVRLTLTDSNNKSTPMDLKLLVLDPSYGTPTQTVQSLASAYSSLQYGPFSAFFDSTGPGISSYLNNMQTTLQTLNSMNINIVSSQDTITCNDAVTRANWQLNYTFKGSPNSVLSSNEQLTVTMHRSPGVGWLISNMIGDNGTVQGALPGPLVTNTALPDLVVSSASLGNASLSSSTPSSINPGQVSVQATIGNIGNADLITNMPVVLSLLDASNTVVSSVTQNLSLPVVQGSNVMVSANLTVPAGANGTKLTLLVNVNPGCSLSEKSCDGRNQQTFPLILQNNVVTLSNVTAAVTVSPGGVSGVISMTVASTIFPVQVCGNAPTGITLNGQTGSVCSSASAAGPVSFNVAAAPGAVTGLQNITFTASNNGNSSSGIPPAQTTTQVPVTIALADLQFGTITFPSVLQAGSTGSVSVPVTNSGNAAAGAGWNIVITVNGTQIGTATGPIVPAGQSVNVTVNTGIPTVGTPPQNLTNLPAVFTVNSNAAISESNTNNNSASATTSIVDFALTTVPTAPVAAIAGRAFSISSVNLAPSPYPFPVTVNYSGLPAGLAASGNANNLVGGLISGAPMSAGSSTVTISGTSSGVTHNASSSITIQTGAEIAFANVTSGLTLLSSGPSGTISMDVSGGVYPISVCNTPPTGVTVTASNGGIKTNGSGNPTCKTLSQAGTLTFTVSADTTAALGAQNLTFTATDAGIASSGVPAGNVNLTVPVTINGAPDLQIGTLSFPSALQMGSTSSVNVPVTNMGNATAAAGWNVVVTINGTQVGTATGPAISAGQNATVPVTISAPVIGTPPQSLTGIAVAVTVNSNAAIVESNPNNDNASATTSLVDFALTTLPTGTQTGVVGRTFSLTAISVAPSSYPLTLIENYVSVPPGLTGGGVTIAGTPTGSGSNTVSITGTAVGVTHSASNTIAVNIVKEITPVESTVPSLVAGDPSQNLTLAVTGGIYPVTLSIALPTGITTTANLSQTLTGPGNVTWDLKADFTAATGASLPIVVHATDAGVPATATPAGNVTFNATYGVNANANYVITNAVWAGHSTPYTGANALQVGESTQLQVTVMNQGNGSPTGTLTVTASCGIPTSCPTPLTGTGAAPTAGNSVVVNLPANNLTLPVASYTGTADVTSNVPGAINGPTATLPFDVVDFTFSANTLSPSQNLPIGGSGTLSLALAEQVPQGGAFGILITPASNPNLSFIPASQTTSGASITFQTNVAAATPPTVSPSTPDTISFSATNHGVTKMTSVPVNYYTAQLVPQNIFVNDAANPLTVPVEALASLPFGNRYPDLSLKMTGNYIGGTAGLTVTNPSCGSFSDNPFPVSAQPADVIDFPIYANSGTNCPSTSVVTIQAAIPNTNPPTNQTVYTLYVAPKGLAQLQVMSATPTSGRNLATQPWLAGEPLDWTVVVKNVGSAPSTGNEPITISLNSAEIGTASLGASIAPNSTGQVVIHTDAPDVPADASFGPTAYMTVHVTLDSQGDLEPGAGDFSQYVNVSNWSITVSGNGASDSSPLSLNLNTGLTSATANVNIVSLQSGTFNPNLTLPLVLGAYSSGQLNPSSLSPNSLTSSAGSNVTVSVQTGQNPLPGSYFAQVIAQMKDGGNVITQRQATIHVSITNSSATTPASITLASDQNNIAACVVGQSCGTPPNVAQVNGPLPTAFTLTASVSYCSGGPCVGNVDIGFTDTFMTNTTPQVSTIAVTSPGNTLPVRVTANTNPDGTINTGSASVMASVSAIQAPFGSARQPTPDPVGSNQFAMAFNIGDLYVSTPGCTNVVPGSTSAAQLSLSYVVYSGFNVPSLSWEWEDSNHLPVGATPLAFSVANGTSTYSSGSYSSLPTFNLTNPSTGIDGLQTYYFAVTVTNGLATATKYFPIQFDLSQSQTFCPNLGASRGSRVGGQIIRGSWGKAGLIAMSHSSLKSSKMPDVRIAATDVSFTPSMPKTGDAVSVRFRVTNVGDVNATAVPIALQVNGNIVVQDTFDVPVGKSTLGALVWNNAKIPDAAPAATSSGSTAPNRPSRMLRSSASVPSAASASASPLAGLNAAVVIDPRQTIQEKTTIAKSAPLAHFSVHDAGAGSAVLSATLNRQRLVLELGEGGCAGLRFNMGAGGCGGSSDVTITVEDLAKGTYRIEAANGVADMGMGRVQSAPANANFNMQVLGQSGHTYAVQLRGGQVGLLTMNAVRNPNQLSEAAQRVFRGPASRVVQKLGNTSAAPEPQTATDSKVYFDIMYQGQ